MQLSDGDEIISLSIIDNVKIDSKTIKQDQKLKKGSRKVHFVSF